MKLLLFIKTFCMAVFLSSANYAAEHSLTFIKLSLDEGVSLNLTYTMLQDKQGFIWFGTMYGLVQYDGNNYKLYRHDPDDPESIAFDDIVSLYEDSKGLLWIGTWGGGLSIYNKNNDKFTNYSAADKEKSISSNIIWCFNEDSKGNIWIGTDNGYVDKYSPSENKFYSYKIIGNGGISKLSVNAINFIDDKPAAGTTEGLFVLKDDKFEKVNVPGKLTIFSLFSDEGFLYAGSNDGIYEYRNETLSKTGLSGTNVSAIAKSKDGRIIAGTSKGIYYKTGDSDDYRKFIVTSPPGNSFTVTGIRSLFIDASNLLWISSYNIGVGKANLDVPVFIRPAVNVFAGKDIRGFAASGSVLWAGTFGDGLYKYDIDKDIISNFDIASLMNNARGYNLITSLMLRGDELWIGTYNGLTIFSTEQNKIVIDKYPNLGSYKSKMILSLIQSGNKIFIGTYGAGLVEYDLKTNQVSSQSFSPGSEASNSILTIFAEGDTLWLGTYYGLVKYEIINNKYKTYLHNPDDRNSLSNNYVFAVSRIDKHNYLIGTSNGLNIFNDSTQSFEHYYEKQGLAGGVIQTILKTGQNEYLIATTKGVSIFNTNSRSFKNYNISDGLASNIINHNAASRIINGGIALGTPNGFNLFYPLKTSERNFKPNTAITSASFFNRDEDKQIQGTEISYDFNNVEFTFASFDYLNPGNNKYKIKLEGYSDEWVISDNNEITYSNLPPGAYKFKVIGSSSSGTFGTNAAIFSFTINAPFWQQWWFISLSALTVILVLIYSHKLRVQQKIKKVKEIERIREEENELIRKKTAVDFHDELGHRLTRISLITEIMKKKLSNSSSPDIKMMLDSISENALQLYNGTRDFIWSIDPNNDSLYDLLVRLKDFGDEIFTNTNISFRVEGISEDLRQHRLNMDWRRHLALIFKEGMNNTLKYSNSSSVKLSSAFVDDNFEISLEDDGIGFIPLDTKGGNGLKNMRKRAAILNSDFFINSRPGAGTKVLFKSKLPKKSLHYN